MVLDKIKVAILGAESLGVRSMCCMVTTPDISLMLDPGCSLGPRKAHEIPHPLEYKKLHEVTTGSCLNRDGAMAFRYPITITIITSPG